MDAHGPAMAAELRLVALTMPERRERKKPVPLKLSCLGDSGRDARETRRRGRLRYVAQPSTAAGSSRVSRRLPQHKVALSLALHKKPKTWLFLLTKVPRKVKKLAVMKSYCFFQGGCP